MAIRIYECYNGSRFSFQAMGEFDRQEFLKKVKEQFSLMLSNQSLGEVIYQYKRYGTIKEPDRERKGYYPCNQKDKDAQIFTKVTMINKI